MDTTQLKTNLSGGELAGAERAEFARVKKLISREDDVAEVLELSYLPEEDRWIYLIRTPFPTWPRFVVGSTDAELADVMLLVRCGAEWSARNEFSDCNIGRHL